MKNTLILFLFLFAGNCFAQQPFVLRDDVLPDITSVNTRLFDKDGLWGYINGGADLYLEYGFEQVTVFDIKAGGIDYKADVYRMASPEAAFGIFSISRFKCQESARITTDDCLTPYQYIAAKGNFYFSISNSSGSPVEQVHLLAIAGNLLDQIENQSIEKPSLFNYEMLVPHLHGLKYISGQLGMQNGFVRWEPLFQQSKSYRAWIMPVKQDGSIFYVAMVDFSDSADMETFMQKNGLKASNELNQAIGNKVFTLFIKQNNRLVLTEGVIPESLRDYLEKF